MINLKAIDMVDTEDEIRIWTEDHEIPELMSELITVASTSPVRVYRSYLQQLIEDKRATKKKKHQDTLFGFLRRGGGPLDVIGDRTIPVELGTKMQEGLDQFAGVGRILQREMDHAEGLNQSKSEEE